MALTKISFEIEVEGTFQNGSTLDKNRIYELLAQVAEEEYDRQFEANRITRRFNFTVTGGADEETTLDLQQEAQVVNIVENATPAPKRKAKMPGFEVPAARLFLPSGGKM